MEIFPIKSTDTDIVEYVEKGKYDIDFIIGLLRMIESKVSNPMYYTQDLQLSLKTSLRKIIAFLEVERGIINNKSKPNTKYYEPENGP